MARKSVAGIFPPKLRKTSYFYVHRGVEDKNADGDVAHLEAIKNITDLELQQREGGIKKVHSIKN